MKIVTLTGEDMIYFMAIMRHAADAKARGEGPSRIRFSTDGGALKVAVGGGMWTYGMGNVDHEG